MNQKFASVISGIPLVAVPLERGLTIITSVGAKEIVVGDGSGFGECIKPVDPLFGNNELHERLLLMLHQLDGPRSNCRHLTLLLPVEQDVRLAIFHLLRLHFRDVHVIVLVPLTTE